MMSVVAADHQNGDDSIVESHKYSVLPCVADEKLKKLHVLRVLDVDGSQQTFYYVRDIASMRRDFRHFHKFSEI